VHSTVSEILATSLHSCLSDVFDFIEGVARVWNIHCSVVECWRSSLKLETWEETIESLTENLLVDACQLDSQFQADRYISF